MRTRLSFATLAFAGLLSSCSDTTQEQSPGEVLARDSSLASELKQADTSAFAEAADVSMAFDPDSAIPAPKPTATATPPSRVPMRPVPATIHPEPLPTRTLPPAPSGSSEIGSAGSPASPNARAILEGVPGASLPPAGNDAPCASPAAIDQRRCLMQHLATSDVGLDHTYRVLIAQMKRDGGTTPGGNEPESVQQLRAAQRAWLVYRDTECRRRNRGKEGPLWAPVRAQCLGEFSGNRERELARALRERR